MNLFRVRGIQIAVHVSFLLLVAMFGYGGWEEGRWPGVLWSLAALTAFFVCITLHELGHSLTARRFGIGVRRILLLPIGGMAEFDEMPREPGRELLITLAGPAVNFVLAGLLWAIVGTPEGGLRHLLTDEVEVNLTTFAQMLMAWNLVMGCFNLVPVFPMDGGRVFRALLATRLPYLRATFIAATVGKVLAVVAVVVALYFFHAGLTAALFAFIFFAGEMEYRAARRREAEEAHWRATLARLNYAPVRADEPPLLSS